jgi:hypothetical protein
VRFVSGLRPGHRCRTRCPRAADADGSYPAALGRVAATVPAKLCEHVVRTRRLRLGCHCRRWSTPACRGAARAPLSLAAAVVCLLRAGRCRRASLHERPPSCACAPAGPARRSRALAAVARARRLRPVLPHRAVYSIFSVAFVSELQGRGKNE